MEGRQCFAHLTIEENLLTGAFTRRDGNSAIKRDLDLVYSYFPKLNERKHSLAGYTSGGEQQMCAIGRALMSRPKMILLDEPSMGLAPQIVEEIFEIVKDLNEKEGVSFLLAEQNTHMGMMWANRMVCLASRLAARFAISRPKTVEFPMVSPRRGSSINCARVNDGIWSTFELTFFWRC